MEIIFNEGNIIFVAPKININALLNIDLSGKKCISQ